MMISPMPIKLHVVKGAEPGQVLLVPDGGSVVIGRSKNADVCLDDKMLSRQHMKVESRQGAAFLMDLASSNGTYLNGERVKESRIVSGDKIKIGSHIFHVEIGEGAAGADGSLAAAQGGLGALAAAAARKEVVFCARCYRAATKDEASESLGGVWLCLDCAEGKPFPETMIEGFKILQQIGDGQLGPVFKARHLALMKNVAIKIIRAERAVDENVVRRFVREAKIGGRLFHPHILEMYDAAVSQSHHYYVTMEWVDGETLHDRVKASGAQPVAEVLRIAAAVAEALGYAHGQKVVHRDVRPANVFLGKKGEVKLGGFGLARPIEAATEEFGEITPPGIAKGTLHFVPPEQLADARSCDLRADIYALGATMYTALAGKPPFDAPAIGEVIENVKAGCYVPLATVRPDCPPEVVQIVQAALAPDRALRYPSAAEMLAAIRAAPGFPA
jgi:tRNA A-37 threonylcarbamoyl transferase component Bud32